MGIRELELCSPAMETAEARGSSTCDHGRKDESGQRQYKASARSRAVHHQPHNAVQLDHVPGQRLGIAVAKGWMSVQLSLMSGKRCMHTLKTSREPLRFCTADDTSVAARHAVDADIIIVKPEAVRTYACMRCSISACSIDQHEYDPAVLPWSNKRVLGPC